VVADGGASVKMHTTGRERVARRVVCESDAVLFGLAEWVGVAVLRAATFSSTYLWSLDVNIQGPC
jgi:hypothetical protein